jgi:hypothetical protein
MGGEEVPTMWTRWATAVITWRAAMVLVVTAWCVALDARDGAVDWSLAAGVLSAAVLALHVTLDARTHGDVPHAVRR